MNGDAMSGQGDSLEVGDREPRGFLGHRTLSEHAIGIAGAEGIRDDDEPNGGRAGED